jgi:uncharacterized RDD family membrane protein YckC
MPIDESRYEYVGFWARAWASLIDSVLVCIIVYPVLAMIYGREYFSSSALIQGPADLLLQWVLPAVAIIAFWIARQATPGKMAIHAKIVDAVTGAPMTRAQAIGRYLGYYVSILGLGFGFFSVGWDKRKQGWHDKLAGTVVVRSRHDVVRRDPVR